jgi:hypothetical protein
MSGGKEYTKALSKARALLHAWRKRRIGNEPYSEELLCALSKAARLGSAGDVMRSLGVNWYRLCEVMDDPRFCGDKESDASCRGKETEVKLSCRMAPAAVEDLPLVTFTQLIPVGNEQGRSRYGGRGEAALEVELPTGVLVRVFDVSPAVLSMVRETALAARAGDMR